MIDGARCEMVRRDELSRELSGEIGPKKGRKKCIYMYIYIGVYSVVACVEPTHDGVPNE